MKPYLQAVQRQDYPALYRIESAAGRFDDWRFRGLSVPPLQYGAMNERRVLRNYFLHGDEGPIALIALHSHSEADETAELAVVRLADCSAPVLGAAVAEVLDEGFDLGLRQVYADVAAYNQAHVGSILQHLFVHAVTRREADYRGRYWDVQRYVLSGATWRADVRPWLGRVRTLIERRGAGEPDPVPRT